MRSSGWRIEEGWPPAALRAAAEIQNPLALAVIGGLGFSTLITLYAVPAVHAALAGGHRIE